MIEIFLFVNPLDEDCLDVARSVCRFPKNRSEKVNIRLVTYPINASSKSRKMICNQNHCFNAEYLSCLAFQAASMQGKKKGNQFFIEFQTLLFEMNYPINEAMVFEAARNAKIDIEMFKEDLYSNLAKNSYQRDKQLAEEMSVKQVPTCIIYYHNECMNKARVESIINDYTLHYACNSCYNASTHDIPAVRRCFNQYK